jgi:hypothetical protein
MVIPAGKTVYVNGHTYRPGDVLPDDIAIKLGLKLVPIAVSFGSVHSRFDNEMVITKPSKKRDKY